jgi:general secretion pathway protein D
MKHPKFIQATIALVILAIGSFLAFGQAPPAFPTDPALSERQKEQLRMQQLQLLQKERQKRGGSPSVNLTNTAASAQKKTAPTGIRPLRSPVARSGTNAIPAPTVNRTRPFTSKFVTNSAASSVGSQPRPAAGSAGVITGRVGSASGTTPATARPPGAPGTQTTAQPATPGNANQTPAPGAALPANANAQGQAAAQQPIIGAGEINFENMELNQVLEYYGELVGLTILRPTSLPETSISIKTETALTKTEAIEAFDTIFAMNGIAVIPFGEKFVKIVPNTGINPEVSAINTKSADELPWADQPITQIITLEYSLPSEVMTAIEPFSKNQGGIVPLDSSNILVIRDYASNVKRMLEIIEKVDVFIPRKIDLEVIPIKFAQAVDISSILSGLTSGGGGGVRSSGTGSSRLGSSSRGGTRTSSTLNRGGSTSRTGSTSSRTSGLRPQSATGSRTGTSGASNFQSRLQQLTSATGGGGIGGDGELLGDAIILPDERTNALLVFGTEEERKLIKDIVEKLDTVQPQVLIEAIIMEVSMDDSRSVGVSTSQRSQGIGNAAGFGGINNLGGLFGSAVTNFPGSLGEGFSYFGAIDNSWEVALQAIATDGRINVLSRPSIQTSHAVEANLFVGDTVPFVTGTFTDITGGGRSQFQNQQVGITLNVLPLINQDGLVVMDIVQEIAQLGVPTLIDGNEVPTTTERNATTKVAVKDGDTIIIGGFISSTKTESKSGVPWLKDIPYLGAMFRSKSVSNQRRELIVLIRPTVLGTPEIAALAAEEARDRLAGVKQAELSIREEEQKRNDKINKEIEKKAAKDERKRRSKSKKDEQSK